MITEYLINKYDAKGIVFYGSRAEKTHRDMSDWDIYVFTERSEADIEDYCEYYEFEGEHLEVSTFTLRDARRQSFALRTAMHPVGTAEVLHDRLDGLIHEIVRRSVREFRRGPEPDTERKQALRLKILRKFMRKAMARSDQKEVVFIAAAQFVLYASRYWFEINGQWPLPTYKAISFIRNRDVAYARNLDLICTSAGSREKMTAMRRTYDLLEQKSQLARATHCNYGAAITVPVY